MLNKLIFCLVFTVVIFCSLGPVQSKPMPRPSFETAVKQSTVVVAKYIGCLDIKKVDYFSGVNCRFKVAKVLKPGMKVKAGGIIKVNYQFDDGTACVAPRPWKFSESMMPKKNSSLILFLNAKPDNVFSTYRGSYGIKKYTVDLEKKVLAQAE